VSKNINLKNNISSSYFNKISYRKDKIKLKRIINEILFSIDNERDVFHSFSKKFKFNFKYSEIKKFSKYQSIILIGMGGSALGAKAIYTFCNNKIKKNLIFLDNLDQSKIKKIKKKINLNKSLFIIVSKSGKTLETLVNSNLLEDKISKKNTIIITDKKINPLNIFAKNKKILTIDHNNYIGGRYSVLSEVGMLPAYFMGLKINLFRKKLLSFLNSKEKNSLLNNVIKLSHIYKYKKINSIIMLNYAPEVNDFLYWCQQLIAESLGKKGRGMLPVVSPSPRDHHSLMQLYLDGPKNKLFYVFSSKANQKMKIKRNIFGKSFAYAENKDFSKVKDAQKKALIQILKKKNIPYQEVIIKKNNEETLGELFSYFITETILVGNLTGINPFDQPAVEQVKVLTKKYLS
jgi:glucose-6-phosphate isomerase|tara:strand:+ start:4159 stop:5370 length:1212 start_codon:yes stop_codon:yes gene_type:complete